MAIDLTDRVCIITGAGRGIGAGVARGFAKRGAQVVATDLSPPAIEQAAMNLPWDVADPAQAQRVVDQVVDRFGRVDCLVANAGIYPRQAWHEITDGDWRKVLAVNLDGAWHAARAVAGPMTERGYGKIVPVTSVEVQMGIAVHAHYDAAKAGIIGLTRSLARALGPRGVRVNAIMPGAILTEGELEQFHDQAANARILGERQCIPDRIMPEMIEPSFAFLCSPESDAVTSQVLCVDHGLVNY